MIIDTIKIVHDFFKLVKGKVIWIVQLFIASILGHITDLFLPIAAANIIGALTIGNYESAYLWTILLGCLYILYYAFWYWNYVAYSYNFKYCYTTLQNKIVDRISTYDEEFSRKVSKGKIVNTCNMDLIESSMFIDIVCEMSVVLVKLIVIIIVFLRIDVVVGIIMILIDLLYMIIMNRNNKQISKHLMGQRKYSDKLTNLLSQTLTGLKEVKVLNFMPKLNKKFDVVREKWSEQYMIKRMYINRKENIIPSIVTGGKIFLYAGLIYMVSIEQIKIETLILLISYYEMFIGSTRSLMNYSLEMRNNGVSIVRMSSIINYKNKHNIEFGLNDNDYIHGLIEFDNVGFKYKKSPVLQNITFKALPNEITAIVGHSGSGKTTIVNLLLRLYKLDSGHILIDGENIYDYSKGVYSSNVSVVNQKPFIFNMSIRDNFSMVDSNKIRQEMVCRRIGIHDFIMSLPNGYNTVLKEDATDISGGQKQLLSLARSLLSNAEVLIFDEITSALDPQLVLHVSNLLNDLKLDHTIIMITHKPDLMKKADNIIVLDRGKIVGRGTHKDLMDEKNHYYVELQSKKFVSDSPVKF